MINAQGSLLRLFSPLFFLVAFPFSTSLQADVEPSMENLVANYFLTDVEGAGDVQVLKEGQTQWQKAQVGARLEEGDQIAVGDDTEVVLTLKSDTLVHLDANTKVSVTKLEDNSSKGFLSSLKLFTGSILSDVRKHLSETNSSFDVNAGGMVCAVRGTVFEVATNGQQVQTSTAEGVVEVKTPKGSQQVTAGQTCSTSPSGASSTHPSNSHARGRFQNWHHMHEQIKKNHSSHGKHGHPKSHSSNNDSTGIRLGHNASSPANHGTTSSNTSHVAPISHGTSAGHR